MTKFEKRFFKTLKEATEDEKAFEAELDVDTDTDDFDVDMEVDAVEVDSDPAVQAAKAQSEHAAKMRTYKHC